VLVTVIHAFKYRGDRSLAAALATLITTRLPIPEDVVVVPVPLHRSRLRARGFNQAALIARAVAQHAGRPFAGQALARRVATSSQAVLGAAARRRNLHDAFVVTHPDAIRGRQILVIDDVITTTATVDACAHALLGAGASRVDAYAVGRTPLGPSP
jgi:ComF family protein